MRIEPEQMLEQHRIAAISRIEEADMQSALQHQQEQSDRDDGRTQNHDRAGGVMRPDKQRQAEPGQARRAHTVNGDDEVQPGQNRREAVDENPQTRRDHIPVRVRTAERRVEGPAGIHAAGEQHIQGKRAAEHVDVPAQQIDSRKCQILGADHQRHQEIAQNSRNRRDQEEEHHQDPVHGEHLVIGVRIEQIAGRSRQFQPDQHRKQTAQKEERRHRDQIQDRDPLVIFRQKPALQPVLRIEIVLWLFCN